MRGAIVRKVIFVATSLALIPLIAACASVDLARYDLSPPSDERLRYERESISTNASRWEEFDLDGDNALSRDEWRAKQWQSFLVRDEDGDGLMNLREYVRVECGVPDQVPELYEICAPRAVLEFVAATGDNDGSGMLGKRDLHGNFDRWFARNDQNRDGRIENREYFNPGPSR